MTERADGGNLSTYLTDNLFSRVLGHTSLQTTSVYVFLARDLMDQQLQANAL
jgi:hypothetical protein